MVQPWHNRGTDAAFTFPLGFTFHSSHAAPVSESQVDFANVGNSTWRNAEAFEIHLFPLGQMISFGCSGVQCFLKCSNGEWFTLERQHTVGIYMWLSVLSFKLINHSISRKLANMTVNFWRHWWNHVWAPFVDKCISVIKMDCQPTDISINGTLNVCCCFFRE